MQTALWIRLRQSTCQYAGGLLPVIRERFKGDMALMDKWIPSWSKPSFIGIRFFDLVEAKKNEESICLMKANIYHC